MKTDVMYLHFDGMDLAGKTTATNAYIKESGLPWEIRRNRLSENNPIHDLADSLRKADTYDPETIGNLYYVALLADISTFRRPTVDTIQDSTIILRSIAYHTVRNTPRLPELFIDLMRLHPKFDASFVFTANIEQRRARLAKRMRETPEQVSVEDMMVIEKPERFLAMEQCLINVAIRSLGSKIIDTSQLSPEAVLAIINSEVSQKITK